MSGEDQDLTIDFSALENCAGFCTTGWSLPEPDGTWTRGSESRLVIPAPMRPTTYVMVVKLRSLVAKGRLSAQRVQVSVNDESLAGWRVDRRVARWRVGSGGRLVSSCAGD